MIRVIGMDPEARMIDLVLPALRPASGVQGSDSPTERIKFQQIAGICPYMCNAVLREQVNVPSTEFYRTGREFETFSCVEF